MRYEGDIKLKGDKEYADAYSLVLLSPHTFT